MAINWLAVIVAAIAMFGLGAVWYSPAMFYRQWQVAAGVSDDAIKRSNTVLVFGVAFILTLLMAANLAFFITGPEVSLGMAVGYAVAAGLGWAALGLAIIALFERRPLSYALINGGYLTIGFALMGVILGAWR